MRLSVPDDLAPHAQVVNDGPFHRRTLVVTNDGSTYRVDGRLAPHDVLIATTFTPDEVLTPDQVFPPHHVLAPHDVRAPNDVGAPDDVLAPHDVVAPHHVLPPDHVLAPRRHVLVDRVTPDDVLAPDDVLCPGLRKIGDVAHRRHACRQPKRA